MPPVILQTLGHGNRSLPELVALLRQAGIARLVDVRTRPVSRRHPHFDRGPLEAALAAAGIRYRWAGRELGGWRRSRPGSPHRALEADGFRGYADHMETPGFAAAARALLEEAGAAATAILCAERQPEQCHRALVADWLAVHGASVIHLIEPGISLPHTLSDTLRPVGGRLVYDRQLNACLDLGEPHV